MSHVQEALRPASYRARALDQPPYTLSLQPISDHSTLTHLVIQPPASAHGLLRLITLQLGRQRTTKKNNPRKYSCCGGGSLDSRQLLFGPGPRYTGWLVGENWSRQVAPPDWWPASSVSSTSLPCKLALEAPPLPLLLLVVCRVSPSLQQLNRTLST